MTGEILRVCRKILEVCESKVSKTTLVVEISISIIGLPQTVMEVVTEYYDLLYISTMRHCTHYCFYLSSVAKIIILMRNILLCV